MKTPTFDFEQLVDICRRTHEETHRSVVRAVDRSLVVRNWLFGWYIVEYEHGGADRREIYGVRLIERLSARLKAARIKGCSPTNLRKFRQFHVAYPEMQQTPSVASAEHTGIHCLSNPSWRVQAPIPSPRHDSKHDSPSAGPTMSRSWASPTQTRGASTRSRLPKTVGPCESWIGRSPAPCTNGSR